MSRVRYYEVLALLGCVNPMHPAARYLENHLEELQRELGSSQKIADRIRFLFHIPRPQYP